MTSEDSNLLGYDLEDESPTTFETSVITAPTTQRRAG